MDYRIVVVGSGAVGKSALTVRFIQGNFIEKYDPTIEDSYRKQVEIDGTAVMLDIMDTAGQEEYGALRDNYMRTGDGFLMVYSVTSRSSFDALQKLKKSILRIKEGVEYPMVLVGNKKDLEDEREVKEEEGRLWAEQNKVYSFIESSALSNTNVAESFILVVKAIMKWREQHPEFNKVKKDKSGRAICLLV